MATSPLTLRHRQWGVRNLPAQLGGSPPLGVRLMEPTESRQADRARIGLAVPTDRCLCGQPVAGTQQRCLHHREVEVVVFGDDTDAPQRSPI